MSFLELNHLQKSYGSGLAVADFHMSIERGEFVSFLGPSGCGKTTTLRMVAGFETPTAGTIMLDGTEITNRPPNRRNVGMVFQSYALFPNMTVAQNIAFGMKLKGLPAQAMQQRVRELLELIRMPEYSTRFPYQLSGGQQQRVALARALAIEPQVLLLDEPLSALDARIRVALRAEIRAIQRHLGITTIYVTHDQEEALSLSDRVVVMSQGQIEQIGTPFEIYNLPATPFVASFVGTLNLLTAEVRDSSTRRLAIGGQELQVTRGFTGTIGQYLTVALRPESLTLESGNSDPGLGQLRGTVADVAFLGSVVRIRIQVADQELHVDMLNHPQRVPVRPGEAVTVRVPEEAALVFDHA